MHNSHLAGTALLALGLTLLPAAAPQAQLSTSTCMSGPATAPACKAVRGDRSEGWLAQGRSEVMGRNGIVATSQPLAAQAGLDGVISSVEEARLIRQACGTDFQVVTPGIRLAKGSDDQKRVQTPRAAVQNGADFFVMGRPVTESPEPVRTVKEIYQSL